MMDKIKCGFININGVKNKVDKVKSVMSRENLDILICVETWLEVGDNAGVRPLLVDIRKGRRDGMFRGNGGICILVKKGIKVRVIHEDVNKNWVMLGVGNNKIIAAYFSPSEDERKVRELLGMVDNMISNNERIMIVGDLNGRVKELTGDSTLCARGRWMKEFIINSGMGIRRSDAGKWTSITNNGRGITDIVLTPRDIALVDRLVVREDESVGGSDHRLLLMDINIAGNIERIIENRWNISKLNTEFVEQQFERELRLELREVNRVMSWAKDQCNEWMRTRVPQSKDSREGVIEIMWGSIKNAINRSLDQSCGKIQRDIYVNRNFYTDRMSELERELRELERLAQESVEMNMSIEERRIRWRRYGEAKSLWVKRIVRRRSVVYRKSIDAMEDPSSRGEFMKIINGMKRRDNQGKSELSRDNMNEHRDHFMSTFGGEPSGSDSERDRETLRDTDNSGDIIIKKHGGIPINLVKQAIKEIAKGKASGIDGIPGEVWMLVREEMVEALHKLFIMCEQLVVIPEEWKTCLVTLIYKNKGAKDQVSNYRPISLTCVIRRLYEKVVKRWYETKVINKVTNNQGGFRRMRSTYDQILRLNEIIGQNKEVIVTFTDIQAAYDCVDRRILWTKLRKKYKISNQGILILRTLFDDNKSKLIVEGEFSEEIINRRGLLQGSSLSPSLFNAFIDDMSAELNEHGAQTGSLGENINNLLFADDAAIIAGSPGEMQLLIDICERWSLRVGIRFKPAKCKVIAKGVRIDGLILYGSNIELVDNHEYLGVVIGEDGIDWDKSMAPRIIKATNRLHWIKKRGMNAFGWRINMSLCIYKAFIRPMLEYGMGLGIIPNKVMKKIQGVQNMAMRFIFSCSKSTSIAALHVLGNIEMMRDRNQILNMLYFQKIILGPKSGHPVGQLVDIEIHRYREIRGYNLLRSFKIKNMWGNNIIEGGMIGEEDIKEYLNNKFRGSMSGSVCARINIEDVVGIGDRLLEVFKLSRTQL